MPPKIMKWTTEYEDILKSLIETEKYTANQMAIILADKFGVAFTRNQVIGKAFRMGMPIGHRKEAPEGDARSPFWNVKRRQLLNDLWNKNLSLDEIGYKIGLARSSVARAAKNFNLPVRDIGVVKKKSTDNKLLAAKLKKSPGTIQIERSMDAFQNPEARRLTLDELNTRSCRYIVGDTMTPNYRYCGADVPSWFTVPYCAVCKNIVYYPSKLQKAQTEKINEAHIQYDKAR